MIFCLFSIESCENTTTIEIEKVDTLVVVESLSIFDTIFSKDTIYSIDTVFSIDTILSIDTIILDQTFKYDSLLGICINDLNNVGYNNFILENIRGTKNAECYNFPTLHLILLKKGFNDTSNLFGYDTLNEWNFKGSNLDSTSLPFAFNYNADLKGTIFSGMTYGYAEMSGIIDSFTVYNPNKCTLNNDYILCGQ